MAVTIATNTDGWRLGNRNVVRLSGGSFYAISVDLDSGDPRLQAYSSADGSSWTLEATGPSVSGDASDSVAIAIDSSDLIHLVHSENAAPWIEYRTYNTTTDVFGSAETPFASFNAITGNAVNAICVDPIASMQAIQNPNLEGIALQVQEKLKKVIEGM